MGKKIVYVDMDNTLADYIGKAKELGVSLKEAKHIPGFFRSLKPMPGAVESYNILAKDFDVYILTTPPWSCPNACAEKMEWVKEWLPNAYKNVIFSHHKNLNIGDYLIDDATANGAGEFTGEHIQIHSDKFPSWNSVIKYIFNKENI